MQADDLWIRSATGTVLDGTVPAVDWGERVDLVGEPGSGKSALSPALLDSVAPGLELAVGNMTVLGAPVAADGWLASPGTLRGLQRRVTRLDQDPAETLTPACRVGYLMTGLSQESSGDAQRLRNEALGVFGLLTTRDSLNRLLAELSGGQRRWVTLARALARLPEPLVLNESTTGLDSSAADAALGLVRQLMMELDATLLIIIHNPAVAARLTSRVVEMCYRRLTNRVPAREVVTMDRLGASRDGRTRGDAEPVLCVRPLTAGAPGLTDSPMIDLDLGVLREEAVASTRPLGSGKLTMARALVGLWPRHSDGMTAAETVLPTKLDD